MTESERPNSAEGDERQPDPGDLPEQAASADAAFKETPPPPPPCEQPPMPGSAPAAAPTQPCAIPAQPFAPGPGAVPSSPQAFGGPSACDPGQPAAQQPCPQAPYPQQPQPAYGQQPPYPQQPYQQPGSPYPQQPYQQAPGAYPPPSAQGSAAPYGQYGQYGQQPSQAYGGGQQPPYPPQPPYPASEPGKRKIWPWVLCGCLLVFLLGIGGCVGCVACASYLDPNYNGSFDSYYDDDYDGSYDPFDDYGNGDYSDSYSASFTLSEIKDIFGSDLANAVEDGSCSPGIYTVGEDIDPGLYFLEGDPVLEGNFYVFDEEGADSYGIDKSVVYIGHYLTELERGDVIAYLPGDDALRMYPIAKASFAPEAPYQSGLYRVGTDIPAGEYAITPQKDAADNTTNESAAYVMKDLEFDDDSITDTKYVIAGGTQTVTVKDGDYLELFAVVATPADQAEKAS